MDMKLSMEKCGQLVRKYRYPILILAIGILLMCFAGKKEESAPVTQSVTAPAQMDLGKELCDILSKIKGAGKVQVLLTVAASETTIYQYDQDTSSTAESNTVRKETVIITDSDRNQQPLITQIKPPVYRGAIIVCQGGDNPQIRLAIVEAVSRATGLGADSISVLKMK
jgi:stage III sporulation protein AG